MIYLHIFLVIVSAHFILYTHGQTNDGIYECYAFTDPHVYSWHPKSAGNQAQYYQDCYSPGYFPIVKNDFVYFKMQIRQRWMTEVELYFYEEGSRIPRCLLTSENFVIHTDDPIKCSNYGITWSTTRTGKGNGYFMRVEYKRAAFSTTIEYDIHSTLKVPHFNIYVWQPQSLATKSSGICTKRDRDCNVQRSADETFDKSNNTWQARQSISREQAQTICKTHVDKYMTKIRRTPYQRTASLNATIENVMAGCIDDVMWTGTIEIARSSLSVLMIKELTDGATSISAISAAIDTGVKEAAVEVDEVAEEASVEVSEQLGIPTIPTTTAITSPTTTVATTTTVSTTTTVPTTTTAATTTITTTEMPTTTTVPLASYKCAIYQDMYIQTWHPTNQASPPTRSCSGTIGNFELVRNKYIRYTIRTSGSTIDELTLILFDEILNNAICTVSVVNQDAGWMDCENNGIYPSLITTATHEMLTVHYAKANFTTVITRDIGINAGRFIINAYLNPELAVHSTGICHLTTTCSNAGGNIQEKKRLIRGIN